MYARYQNLTLTILVAVAFGSGCNVDPVWTGPQVKGPDVRQPSPGIRQPDGGRDIYTIGPGEVDFVEETVAARNAYHEALSKLQNYYAEHGYATKESWARFELDSARNIRQFRYVLDAEIPREDLHATESIAEADEMFEKGLERMRHGGHGVPLFYRRRVMLEAADIFRELIERHPSSDKIDDAAFQLGEIHNEYLPDQEELAVRWYERAWTWNPETPHPARFQAASVCDFRLHDRDRALELYHQVIDEEAGGSSANAAFASKRIEELSGQPRRQLASDGSGD